MFRRKANNRGNYTQHNRVRLVKGGHEYFSLLLKLIADAKYCIDLQYYIYLEDETGILVTEALKKAAARGVIVYLHIDAYASKRFSKDFLAGLKEAGVHFKRFEPLLKSRRFYFGRRLHHKVFVADGLYSLVGGINISDHYNDLPGKPAWLDMAIYCEGEASMMLHRICRTMWGKKILRDNIPEDNKEKFYATIPKGEQRMVAVSRNDWVKKKSEVWRNYAYMFNHAEKEIWIMCSYFLPGWAFRRQLSRAVKRGVKVKVILAGTSDIMVAKHAERFLYDWMLRRNIGIYEYQRTVLHAKVAAYDNEWATVGSFNVNNISTYASLELNVDIKHPEFVNDLKNTISEIIENDSEHITAENYKRSTNIFRKLWQRLCYGFINITLRVFTFYFKQE
jgi:cardiolipin synthase A/B